MDDLKPRRVSQRKLRELQQQREFQKANWREMNVAPLERLICSGVPSMSLQLYAKWWQLERWLRDLVQLELQVRFGRLWENEISQSIITRRDNQGPALQYMPSSDDGNPLGFADFGNLTEIIAKHWSLFSYALPPQTRWHGTVDTLNAVRRRIAHCRNPHQDDLARVDQGLRDLQSGSRLCLTSYASRNWLDDSNEIAAAFSDGGDKGGRLKHAMRQYETSLHICVSTRPWSSSTNIGTIYHAQFSCCDRSPDPEAVWEYLSSSEQLPDVIHLNFASFNTITLSFVPKDAAAGIEVVDDALEAILTSQRHFPDEWFENWVQRVQDLDYRVRCDDYFAFAGDIGRVGVFGTSAVPRL